MSENKTPQTPPELDAIADTVLRYKPKPKSKAAKRRARKQKRAAPTQRIGATEG